MPQFSSVEVADIVAAQFGSKGYVRISNSSVSMSREEERSREQLKIDTRCMPPDPGGGGRRRVLGHFLKPAGSDAFAPLETAEALFSQPANLHSDHGAAVRSLPQMPRRMLRNLYLSEKIDMVFGLTRRVGALRWMDSGNLSVIANVHIISYDVTAGTEAVATPNRPHRDGEPCTYNEVLELQGVDGGDTEIYDIDEGQGGPQPGALLFKGPLEPGDTSAVIDTMVYHHATPMACAPGWVKGRRTVLLIDFSPMLPVVFDASGSLHAHLALAHQAMQRLPA